MTKSRTAAWGLLVAGVLWLVPAVIPLAKGGSVNVTFLILAGVFIVLGTIVARRDRTKDPDPPAA